MNRAFAIWCALVLISVSAQLGWVQYCCVADDYRIPATIQAVLVWSVLMWLYLRLISMARGQDGKLKKSNRLLIIFWGGLAVILSINALFGSRDTWDEFAGQRYVIGISVVTILALVHVFFQPRLNITQQCQK